MQLPCSYSKKEKNIFTVILNEKLDPTNSIPSYTLFVLPRIAVTSQPSEHLSSARNQYGGARWETSNLGPIDSTDVSSAIELLSPHSATPGVLSSLFCWPILEEPLLSNNNTLKSLLFCRRLPSANGHKYVQPTKRYSWRSVWSSRFLLQ